jgi:hypothetical protein
VEYGYLDDHLVRVRRPSNETLALVYRNDGRLDEVIIRRRASGRPPVDRNAEPVSKGEAGQTGAAPRRRMTSGAELESRVN